MTEKKEQQKSNEVESLNTEIVDADGLSDEDLEDASGGCPLLLVCGAFSHQ